MVLKMIRKRWTRARPARFSAPIDARGLIYAVGDIHGRRDLLESLLGRIFDDAAAFGETPKIVFMGDYIDRGEHSRETVDVLMALARQTAAETVFLMGNHEEMLLRFLREPATGGRWLRYGGLQTLMSYGVGRLGSVQSESEALRLRGELVEALGPHLGFLEGLHLSHRAGNLFFAHAGADPAVPVEEQEVDTLLWGCREFATTEREDGIWVVHGHVIVDQPSAEHGRIAIDTGAYFSGRLTAARIAGGETVFLKS